MNNSKKHTIFVFVVMVLFVSGILYSRHRRNANLEYVTVEGFVFGTTYHITYQPVNDDDITPHIENAFKAIDNSLSMFNEQSTISQFNFSAQVQPDPMLAYVWKEGVKVSQYTHGYFDMTVAPLVNLWGFGFKNRSSVTDEQVDSILKFVGYSLIACKDGMLVKSDPRVMLDASAIAKGYACDVVADTLAAYGVENMCVEIGGEMVLRGVNRRGDLWNIGVNSPEEDSTAATSSIMRTIKITDRAMATSGNYRNFYEVDGKRYAHTIDPFTGRPVQHALLSATILAPTCMKADAIATACMAAGLDSACAWVEGDETLSAYFIYRSADTLAVKSIRLE